MGTLANSEDPNGIYCLLRLKQPSETEILVHDILETSTYDSIFMPPTLKKLKGNIALGLSVLPSVKNLIWF